MDNEKIMREKAEQMTKKAEMKIQQAKEKEAKYQQWLENKKQNDPNFRDYDENPLIIQSYEKFFVLLTFTPLYLGFAFFYLIMNLMNKDWYVGGFKFLSIFAAIYIIVAYLIHKFRYKDNKIKFTNRYIEFYDDGKLKRQCEVIYDELARPFFVTWMGYWKYRIMDLISVGFVIFLLFVEPSFIIFIIAFYFSNFLINLCFYLFINMSLKGFKMFPFIRVTSMAFPNPNPYGGGFVLSARYYLIYLYNQKIYQEVKKYFLQKNINIDYLSKQYNVM
ncbi:CCDC34 family protein [Campylobacter sp. VBCF_06 NA8]|uniref:hypothetical protein n=1 Tax=unclassified Campylobacter TaxID=2593542 RepID=UPI0022E9C988|nr:MULTISPECIES: hypothetical protein [unclassified Campylobacter]MDA3045619.1 CCDC34 family protein [Campylobacter sp. VBCF_06 NA8]MDA3054725.1 CCDC34 family protein [Campylobacter sp. VBCF_07 NA4]